MAGVRELEPTGAAPFDEADCGDHLPCPEWMVDQNAWQPAEKPEEPELESPVHLHDLWAALGLGEE
jgi:hypothetical protein